MRTREVFFVAALAAPAAWPASAETPLERGDYLVNSIAGCGNCHTPLGPDGPIADMELAGRLVEDGEPFTAYAPNITPHPETGVGTWSDEELIIAIREGKRPDGSILGPPMPFGLYRGMSDSDVQAILAYLRQLPPIDNEVPASTYRIPLPDNYGPPVGTVADVEPGVTVEYGAYLAGPVGHCIECHTPMVDGQIDFENQLGAGGFEFHGPWGTSVSANITPQGIGDLTDEELAQIITTGVRADGTQLLPPMGFGYYANMTPDDVAAIILYLRSLPSKPDPA